MSLRKRGGIWWIDFTAPNGERVRRTTGTANKALAQEAQDRLKAELWRIAHLDEKPRWTWNEAVVRWLILSLAAFVVSLLYTYVLTNGGAVTGQQMAITSASSRGC